MNRLFTQMLNTVTCGDCIDVMAHLPARSVDFVLTDPPYVVRYHDRSGRRVINDDNDAWLKPAFAQILRVLKPDTLCVSFYGWNKVDLFMAAWRAAGFQPVGQIIFRKQAEAPIEGLFHNALFFKDVRESPVGHHRHQAIALSNRIGEPGAHEIRVGHFRFVLIACVVFAPDNRQIGELGCRYLIVNFADGAADVTEDDVIAAVDKQLYRAKRAGRNDVQSDDFSQ